MKAMRILLAVAALAGAAPASAELDLKHADVSRLPNGLTVIMLEDRSFPLVSVQMLYKSGSAAEVTGKTGLAHFLEHLAFRGSRNFPDARATELIYDSGGEWHGYTAMDQTTYFATMPRAQLDLLLKIEADRMARIVIDPASIEAEKGAVITELHGYENDPASVLLESVTRMAIQSHPYGTPMAGYVSDVERLTAEDARAYYSTHYAPGNAVLAIVGDFTSAQAKALVAKAFADVPARAVAQPNFTSEPPQRGERRALMLGPVERQYFQLAFPSPAASSPDFPAMLVLQEILSGGSGLNLRQSDWTGTEAASGSLLGGATADVTTWLPPTREPFLFTIGGSLPGTADRASFEQLIRAKIDLLGNDKAVEPRLANAKAAVIRALADDVQTTEDAAHQLAFFEGIGALDALLGMPGRVSAVTTADIARVALTYLAPHNLTVGWMLPGTAPSSRVGVGNPHPSDDRPGLPAAANPAGQPRIRRLSGGLPAIVQTNPLSDTVTVELLTSAPVMSGARPAELPGSDAVVRSGSAGNLNSLLHESVQETGKAAPAAEKRSEDPAARLEQIILEQIGDRSKGTPQVIAAIVSGNVEADTAFEVLERQLGRVTPARISRDVPVRPGPKIIRERIAKPLAQGAIGYVVEGPEAGTRHELAWRMLLYVLTHDYSGRLGRSAIGEKGLVYYIGSSVRTNGRRSWATLSIGVDPAKADAMEAELRAQLDELVRAPPTAAETEAARRHLLGRDLTAAQSNEELAAKLARNFAAVGGLRSHEQLRELLRAITSADLADLTPFLAKGTLIRVDVGGN